MNLVDSSGWLEYFADTNNSKYFADPIEDTENLIVPTICLYEVFKKVKSDRTEDEALQVVALMEQGKTVELDSATALSAANISCNNKLPMADSIILATARANDAILWTQDADFKGLDGVRYRAK